MRTIAIVNQKGGCGKTTTAINLAAVYASRGTRTLLIDLDPQAHCAAGLGVPEKNIEYSIGDAMRGDLSAGLDSSRLIWEVARNLHLAPSTMRLAMLEAPEGGLHKLEDKDRRLQAVLEHLAGKFDRCLIDCAPTIGLLTFNALRAAREVLIPVETGYFSLRGAEKQWETIQRVIKRIDRPIACHIVPTLHDPTLELAEDILASLQRQFAGQILPVVVREHAELREAASLGQSIVEYAPHSEARQDFETLADWLDEHHVKPLVEIEVVSVARPLDPARGAVDRAAPARDGAPQAGASATGAGGEREGGRAGELVQRLRALEDQIRGRREQVHEAAPCAAIPDAAAAVGVLSEPDGDAIPLVTAPILDTGEESEDSRDHAFPSIAGAAPAACSVGAVAVKAAEGVREELVEAMSRLRRSEALRSRMKVMHEAALATAPLQVETSESEASDAQELERAGHLYGVRATSRGVLFVQPANDGETIYVAGDFNRWRPRRTPLRLNQHLNVLEALVQMPPGRHTYRLVVGPRWIADPFNGHQERNEHGELNSIVVVPDRQATP